MDISMTEIRNHHDEISILTFREPISTEPDSLRSPFDGGNIVETTTVKLGELSEGVREFMAKMGNILRAVQTKVGEFSLDEVEVSAGINASGKLTLFGITGV
jgi:hypothetical protein